MSHFKPNLFLWGLALTVFSSPALAGSCFMSQTLHCMCGKDRAENSMAGSPIINPLPAIASDEVIVQMVNFTFEPALLTVYTGTTVTWVNLDDFVHDTVDLYGLWDSGYMGLEGSFSFIFDEGTDGIYDYVCTLHGGMTGSITVLVPEPGAVACAGALMLAGMRRRSRVQSRVTA